MKVYVKWQMSEAEETIPVVFQFMYIGQFINWYVQTDKRNVQEYNVLFHIAQTQPPSSQSR